MIARGALIAALLVSLFATPCAATAPEPGKVPRLGVLGPTSRSDSAHRFDAFRQGLRQLGWVE